MTDLTPIPMPRRPRVLALANQKGGVGKTTTAINLGTALAAIGEKVLIVDLDPQGNASTGLGVDRRSRKSSTYDVLCGDVGLGQAMQETAVPGLFLAPSTLDLLGVELEIAASKDRAHRLKNAIDELVYDQRCAGLTYVLIDCPPSLSLITINAMTASDAVLVPLQCEFFALEGLSQVLTMYDPRNNLSGQVMADVREFLGDKVYETVIPRNVRVSEAPSYGKPALLYDLRCSGSQAYLKLASEVIRRERALRAAA